MIPARLYRVTAIFLAALGFWALGMAGVASQEMTAAAIVGLGFLCGMVFAIVAAIVVGIGSSALAAIIAYVYDSDDEDYGWKKLRHAFRWLPWWIFRDERIEVRG